MTTDPFPCTTAPILFDSTKTADHLEAKRMCQGCPILLECRATAVAEFRAYLAGRAPLPAEGTRGGALFTHESLRGRARTTTQERGVA